MSNKELLEFSKVYIKNMGDKIDPKVAKQVLKMEVGQFTELKNMTETNLRAMKVVEEAFAVLDKSGSGYITKKDLHTGLNALGIAVTEEESDRIVKEFSRNENRGISYDEFVLMAHKGFR
ncbi:hypothetical protein MHBO_002532 [Bonamia ostreae]|uniref:EF-hand domain-containing protein n=1 Tax=Bonamia ostreae TaxID=126728 RepID=A0ABV2ANA0_9EUKA